MKNFEGLTLDEERSLYGIADAMVKNCRFSGPLDGESAPERMHKRKYKRLQL